MNVFKSYSKYYDLLYQDKDYQAEVNYICSLLKRFSPNSTFLFEMGCGTGKHAKILSENGFNVYGIDISESMLQLAKAIGVKCEIGDARFFRAGKIFDCVLSLFHVASYQTSVDDILNYFETASSHLNPGGIFIFDLWYKPAVLSQQLEKRVKEMENDSIKVKRNCSFKHIKEQFIVDINYDLKITDKLTGKIENISEKHSMKYFSIDEIKNFAGQKNIEIIHAEEWLSAEQPSEDTWNVCFIGLKK